jgi:hypothetical protein
MKVMTRIFQCSQAKMGRFQPGTSYAVARTIGSRDAVGERVQRTKAQGKPFWPTFRICMAKEAAQKMRVDAAPVERSSEGYDTRLFN